MRTLATRMKSRICNVDASIRNVAQVGHSTEQNNDAEALL